MFKYLCWFVTFCLLPINLAYSESKGNTVVRAEAQRRGGLVSGIGFNYVTLLDSGAKKNKVGRRAVLSAEGMSINAWLGYSFSRSFQLYSAGRFLIPDEILDPEIGANFNTALSKHFGTVGQFYLTIPASQTSREGHQVTSVNLKMGPHLAYQGWSYFLQPSAVYYVYDGESKIERVHWQGGVQLKIQYKIGGGIGLGQAYSLTRYEREKGASGWQTEATLIQGSFTQNHFGLSSDFFLIRHSPRIDWPPDPGVRAQITYKF